MRLCNKGCKALVTVSSFVAPYFARKRGVFPDFRGVIEKSRYPPKVFSLA
jgi:hypothetical protein